MVSSFSHSKQPLWIQHRAVQMSFTVQGQDFTSGRSYHALFFPQQATLMDAVPRATPHKPRGTPLTKHEESLENGTSDSLVELPRIHIETPSTQA